MAAETIPDQMPEVDQISDAELREAVVSVWRNAIDASDFDDLREIPWTLLYERKFADERLLEHTRQVTRCAESLVDQLSEQQETEIDRDAVIAGALLHDVSKLREATEVRGESFKKFIPHPYYGIHLLCEENISVPIQHIVASHTTGDAIEPYTLEAEIVKTADYLTTRTAFWAIDGTLDP